MPRLQGQTYVRDHTAGVQYRLDPLGAEAVNAAFAHKLHTFFLTTFSGVLAALVLDLAAVMARAFVGPGLVAALGFLGGLGLAVLLRGRFWPGLPVIVCTVLGGAVDTMTGSASGIVIIPILGLLVGAAAGVAMMLTSAVAEWRDWIEETLQVDLNGDGWMGRDFVVVNARSVDAAAARREQAEGFIRGCATDSSQRRWEPVLGRTLYVKWRDVLLHGGFAAWNIVGHERQGWRLTAEPDDIIAGLSWRQDGEPE